PQPGRTGLATAPRERVPGRCRRLVPWRRLAGRCLTPPLDSVPEQPYLERPVPRTTTGDACAYVSGPSGQRRLSDRAVSAVKNRHRAAAEVTRRPPRRVVSRRRPRTPMVAQRYRVW